MYMLMVEYVGGEVEYKSEGDSSFTHPYINNGTHTSKGKYTKIPHTAGHVYTMIKVYYEHLGNWGMIKTISKVRQTPISTHIILCIYSLLALLWLPFECLL